MFRWREIEEGERAARPCVRSVSGKPKEKEKKKLTRKMSLFGLMGRTKNSRKTRRRLILSTDWSKSVLSASAKQPEDLVCSTQGMAICSLYIEDALPSTSRCTCRLNNVHTCQQIANYSHMLFFSILPLPPTSPTQQFHSPNIRHLG